MNWTKKAWLSHSFERSWTEKCDKFITCTVLFRPDVPGVLCVMLFCSQFHSSTLHLTCYGTCDNSWLMSQAAISGWLSQIFRATCRSEWLSFKWLIIPANPWIKKSWAWYKNAEVKQLMKCDTSHMIMSLWHLSCTVVPYLMLRVT